MINYKENKKRIKPNKLGSLYINNDLDKNRIPTIYIGGQMEHRLHILEQTGYTLDQGHNLFDGSWFYDYPLNGNTKSYNIEGFSNNLLLALKEANIKKVNLITESCGGLVALGASHSDIVEKIIAIHPPIFGTPLSNIELLNSNAKILTKKENIIRIIINMIVNEQYGFQQNNSLGIESIKCNLEKLIVLESSLNPSKDTTILKDTYNIIKKITGYENDGVVVLDKILFIKYGINYLEEENNLNHFASQSKSNIISAYNRVLKK